MNYCLCQQEHCPALFTQAKRSRPVLLELPQRNKRNSQSHVGSTVRMSVQPAVWIENVHPCPGLGPLSRRMWAYCLSRALLVADKQEHLLHNVTSTVDYFMPFIVRSHTVEW